MRAATAINDEINATHTKRAPAAADSRLHLHGNQDEALLKLDLSDLVLPKVDNLHVDGLKSSWLSRLFSKS